MLSDLPAILTLSRAFGMHLKVLWLACFRVIYCMAFGCMI